MYAEMQNVYDKDVLMIHLCHIPSAFHCLILQTFYQILNVE